MNIQKWALQLVEQYPDKFTTDFQVNKRLVTELTPISSKFFRNKIAGYIIRLIKKKTAKETRNTGLKFNSM